MARHGGGDERREVSGWRKSMEIAEGTRCYIHARCVGWGKQQVSSRCGPHLTWKEHCDVVIICFVDKALHVDQHTCVGRCRLHHSHSSKSSSHSSIAASLGAHKAQLGHSTRILTSHQPSLSQQSTASPNCRAAMGTEAASSGAAGRTCSSLSQATNLVFASSSRICTKGTDHGIG